MAIVHSKATSPYLSRVVLTTALPYPGNATPILTNLAVALGQQVGVNFIYGFTIRATGTAEFYLQYIDANAILPAHFPIPVFKVSVQGDTTFMFEHPSPINHGFGGGNWQLWSSTVNGAGAGVDHVTVFLGD